MIRTPWTYVIIALLAFGTFSSCSTRLQIPKREFRGVWIATVNNLDWPSRPGLKKEQQCRELDSILTFHQQNGFNAVILQVRPAADAFYKSEYEPWSQWLSGKQGTAPEAGFDPLAYAVKKANDLGLEFHAWINPYRAIQNLKQDRIDPQHISRRKPEWFIPYGNRLYFDPGLPEVREYLVKVVMEVARNYPVDGIHFDDYFYPYALEGQQFADTASFRKYGNGLALADWRRQNVNELIRQVSDSLKQAKPLIKFGISPFGIWRNQSEDPNGSETKGSQSNFDHLYADVLLWLKNGWIDYVIPQLYWHIGYEKADFKVLLKWWSRHTYGKHIYIGHGAYRVDEESDILNWRSPEEIPNQLKMIRQFPEIKGSAFFSSRVLQRNPLGVTDSLRDNYYRHPALVPVMEWKDATAPASPVELKGVFVPQGIRLSWNYPQESKADQFVVYRTEDGSVPDISNPRQIIAKVPSGQFQYEDHAVQNGTLYKYVVTALDQAGNESVQSNVLSSGGEQ